MINFEDLGLVVQSLVSLMISLAVKMLTVLVSTISYSRCFFFFFFFAEKIWVAFANAKATHIFFSKNISTFAIFDDQSLNDTLTNDIVSLTSWALFDNKMKDQNLSAGLFVSVGTPIAHISRCSDNTYFLNRMALESNEYTHKAKTVEVSIFWAK